MKLFIILFIIMSIGNGPGMFELGAVISNIIGSVGWSGPQLFSGGAFDLFTVSKLIEEEIGILHYTHQPVVITSK